MTRDQIKLSRQNVVTIVKGTRERDHTDEEIATSVTRQERKTGASRPPPWVAPRPTRRLRACTVPTRRIFSLVAGDFTMTFRIPEEFNRRWDSAIVDNGVLKIRYLKDTDEEET